MKGMPAELAAILASRGMRRTPEAPPPPPRASWSLGDRVASHDQAALACAVLKRLRKGQRAGADNARDIVIAEMALELWEKR